MQNQLSQNHRTVTQQFQAHRNRQGEIRLDAEVRQAALSHGAGEEEAAELVITTNNVTRFAARPHPRVLRPSVVFGDRYDFWTSTNEKGVPLFGLERPHW